MDYEKEVKEVKEFGYNCFSVEKTKDEQSRNQIEESGVSRCEPNSQTRQQTPALALALCDSRGLLSVECRPFQSTRGSHGGCPLGPPAILIFPGMAKPPQPPSDGIADDFFEQIFSMPGYASGDGVLTAGDGGSVPGMVTQFNPGDGAGSGNFPVFPLGLSLDQGRSGFAMAEEGSSGGGGKRLREAAEGKTSSEAERDSVQLASLFPAFGHVQSHQVRPNAPQILHGQSMQAPVAPAPQPPAPRPRVRARRGQATDPHSIAERLRRERIAERMRALQELVPNTNKTDRAAMLDEIVDYVKFLRLQVKVLSMSRLGGAGAVAQLVADIPLSQSEGDSSSDGRSKQQIWEKWSTDGTERQVAKLMEEDVGAAMQFLQSKALCMMPISLAAAIYHTQHQPDNASMKHEPNTPPS